VSVVRDGAGTGTYPRGERRPGHGGLPCPGRGWRSAAAHLPQPVQWI